MSSSSYEKVKINDVEVDFVALKLLLDGEWHDIEAKQLSLLKLLIDQHGQAVSRERIMDNLWQDTIVSDNSVSQIITQLRKSLGDDKGAPRFIKTVPRIGYQLIAQLEFPEITAPQANAARQHKRRIYAVGFGSAILAVLATLGALKLSEPNLQAPSYQYESRLTSTPGPESYLRYSADGRYLAFSQMSENRQHMNLSVYDSHTQSVHTIKNTGYSEEAPEWSPDGQWLVYFRHDPFSCEIRYMSVKNPIETWRISPDRHLAYCNAGFSRQKMHWLNDNTLYYQGWEDNLPRLIRLSLTTDKIVAVSKTETVSDYRPLLFDIDKGSHIALIVEANGGSYQLYKVNLQSGSRSLIEEREREYWGLKWHKTGESFWLGNESLRLTSVNGHSEIVHLPVGYVPDLDLNPVTHQLAHAEGVVNVNLYSADLNHQRDGEALQARRLSSAARTDVLPTISNDGNQTAFISYQRRATDGLRHAEIWLKNKYKKAATLLVNLPEEIIPRYILWSPNDENLLIGDSNYKLYLVNIYSKHMVPIIPNYQAIDQVNWTTDGKYLNFLATTNNEQQRWQYDLQLSTTELVVDGDISNSTSDFNLAWIKRSNPSYRQYLHGIAAFLSTSLAGELPVDNLLPSLRLYRPFVFEKGIYYVVKQGHQLTLYLYHFDSQSNQAITLLGSLEQDVNLVLNVSASQDGKQLVFSMLEGLETDISVQKPLLD